MEFCKNPFPSIPFIGKRTDDIKCLQSKIDLINDKNETLLAKNFELRLENIKLTSCLHMPPPSSLSAVDKEAISRETTATQTAFTSKGERMKEMISDIPESTKQLAIEKIQAQWIACPQERRKKYEQHKVASNLSYTRQNLEGQISTQLNNIDLHNRVAIENDRCREIRTGKAKNPDTCLLTENTTQKRTTRVSIADGVICEKTKTSLSTQELHAWKKETVLIMGDSMLHGIDERRMSKNGLVKVRCFPGATVADLKNFYMQPLLSKKPSHVIIHVGTNDAANKDSTADSILNGLLDLKKDIEVKLPNVTVMILTPMKRTDQPSAGKIIEQLNKKIRSLRLSTVDNNNISQKEIGCKGLHLNDKGVSKFASNLVAKLRSI